MKKKTKVLIIALLLLLLTGCTKTLKDGKNAVTYEETGQTLTANILCKPSDEDLLNKYEEYNDKLTIGLDELPSCKNFTPNKIKYTGLWESLFVKPLGWLILKVGYLIKDMGIAVMLVGLLIRLIMFPIQIKNVIQTENMKKVQPELQKIEKKYANKTDNESLMAKSQETMLLYKKYQINPVSGCLMTFIQLPLFFAFLEAINRVPAIFEGKFLNTNMYLGMTPSTGIAQGHYSYIILIVLIILTTFLSFKNSMASQGQNNEMAQQMKMMSIFMILMVSFASLSLPTAIALYWIVTNGFAVVQNFIIKKIIEKRI